MPSLPRITDAQERLLRLVARRVVVTRRDNRLTWHDIDGRFVAHTPTVDALVRKGLASVRRQMTGDILLPTLLGQQAIAALEPAHRTALLRDLAALTPNGDRKHGR